MTICPVCASGEWRKRYRIEGWTIEECEACGFAYIDPMPVREDRPGCYSEEKVVDRNTKEKNPLQKLSRFFKRLFSKAANRDKGTIFYNKLCSSLQPGSKVLDIGCGDGSFICKAKGDFVCTGIEISGYLASLAGKRPGIRIIIGDFLETDFKDERYDCVTMISILEHLDDPLAAVKKCFGLLEARGLLLLKTVNYGSFNRSIRGGSWTGFRPPDHVVYFKPSNLELMLKNTGFKKINISAAPFNDNMYCEAFK